MTSPLDDPRVEPVSYKVTATCADLLPPDILSSFTLIVTNGGRWGWSIRRGQSDSSFAMNRKGQWICESRGSGHNKARRWELEEAIQIALKNVDTMIMMKRTAQEWADYLKEE